MKKAQRKEIEGNRSFKVYLNQMSVTKTGGLRFKKEKLNIYKKVNYQQKEYISEPFHLL